MYVWCGLQGATCASSTGPNIVTLGRACNHPGGHRRQAGVDCNFKWRSAAAAEYPPSLNNALGRLVAAAIYSRVSSGRASCYGIAPEPSDEFFRRRVLIERAGIVTNRSICHGN